jgi:hypothetical protein
VLAAGLSSTQFEVNFTHADVAPTRASNDPLAAGTYSVTAKYNGDANFSTSTSAAGPLTIAGDSTSIQLSSKSCNEINVALANGVSTVATPTGVCPNDLTSSSATFGTPHPLYGGVATPTGGGTAGGKISAYTLCPYPGTAPCPAGSVIDPNNFVTLITFTETNSFTVGQTVMVTNATNIDPSVVLPPGTPPSTNSATIFDIPFKVTAATATSWTGVLTSYVATAQGASIDATVFVRPSNTLSGTMTFSCSGLPANAACTFSPTSLTLTAGSAVPAYTPVIVTFFTDLQPGTGGTSSLRAPAMPGHRSPGLTLAMMLGWPITLVSLIGLVGLRKRNGWARAGKLVALLVVLAGSSAFFSGCGSSVGTYVANLTPAGTYPITITATDGSVSSSIVINFIVTSPGITGQE